MKNNIIQKIGFEKNLTFYTLGLVLIAVSAFSTAAQPMLVGYITEKFTSGNGLDSLILWILGGGVYC
ncbi:hypothetical protein [Rothia nasisuis]|uniref:hypothetical protein n=1 Tax=Rothia nasisuis TaxID=2109647 RepID=UPI001F3A754C|nr:hypothetical protein [Rothia nasisuis]